MGGQTDVHDDADGVFRDYANAPEVVEKDYGILTSRRVA
jgi:hypothetical protein